MSDVLICIPTTICMEMAIVPYQNMKWLQSPTEVAMMGQK